MASLAAVAARGAEVSDSATIHFRQSHWHLDTAYDNNGAALDSLTRFIDLYSNPDSAFTLSRVRVVGSASPEGSVAINERLSRQRAESIFDYFTARKAISSDATEFYFAGRDWRGLRRLVENDQKVPCRAEVIAILDDILNAGTDNVAASDRGLARLRSLDGGAPYRYMYVHLFPQLRASRLYVEYIGRPDNLIAVDTTVTLIPEDTVIAPFEPEIVDVTVVEDIVKEKRPFYMALKTNMLYDALALPSVGAEFYVGRNWSVGANWTYGWWDNNNRHRYWRAYGGDINVRRWFGRRAEEKPLTGHHIGLYAGVITYDFEFGGKGYMGGLPRRTLWDRCNYMGGIEYGYSLPVGRRLNIDFTIGIGYLGGKYLEYVPKDNRYVWQATKRLNWFGPTKAEISLVWLIGRGNYNRSAAKGGDL